MSPVVPSRTQIVLEVHTVCYRLILLNREGTHVLLDQRNHASLLPRVRIPKFMRPAERITSRVNKLWGVRAVLLFFGLMDSREGADSFAVLEDVANCSQVPREMSWLPVPEAVSQLFDKKERDLLASCHAKAVARCSVSDPEPFARLGWIHKLEARVRAILNLEECELGTFLQLNGCETFSLIRFQTKGRSIWFKAVGEPNLHEFPITMLLARLLPGYLPPVLASEPSLRGWFMESGGDVTLSEVESPTAWRSAGKRLAKLQVESVDRTDDFLQTGCRDLRVQTMLGFVDPFLDGMACLMELQTKIPPEPLTLQELSNMGPTLKEALQSLAEVGIPETLGHSDFNSGNVLWDGKRCVFIDWAEAHVSFPFLTLEYLASALRLRRPTFKDQEEVLRKSYTECWCSAGFSESIERALLFTPLVAVYAYALTGNAWCDPNRLAIPHIPGYLRSLTRRMKQEADLLQRRRVECPN